MFKKTIQNLDCLLFVYYSWYNPFFLRNAKEELKSLENSKEIMMEFPAFGAACIAAGCKQREAAEHVQNLPVLTQVELLSAVFALTFPEGLKKSLEKLAPTIVQLLRK